MTQTEMFTILRAYLAGQLAAFGMPALVLQAYQPTQQGAPPIGQAQLIMHLINTRRYGFQGRRDVWNPDAGVFDTVESCWQEQTVQFGGFMAETDPANPPPFSAGDLTDRAAMILQSYHAREHLLGYGIGFFRIMDVRKPYFENDQGRHEMSPSFDLTLTYKTEIVYATPRVTAAELETYRV